MIPQVEQNSEVNKHEFLRNRKKELEEFIKVHLLVGNCLRGENKDENRVAMAWYFVKEKRNS